MAERDKFTPVAEQIPFDPTGTDFPPEVNNVDDALRNLDQLTFENITEAETYFEADLETTTSNGWITAFQVETAAKTAGEFIILHSSIISQSASNKVMGYRVQYRLNATGAWIDLLNTTYEGRASTDVPYTSISTINTSNDDTIEVRFEFGLTTGGGTASISNKGFILWKVKN